MSVFCFLNENKQQKLVLRCCSSCVDTSTCIIEVFILQCTSSESFFFPSLDRINYIVSSGVGPLGEPASASVFWPFDTGLYLVFEDPVF